MITRPNKRLKEYHSKSEEKDAIISDVDNSSILDIFLRDHHGDIDPLIANRLDHARSTFNLSVDEKLRALVVLGELLFNKETMSTVITYFHKILLVLVSTWIERGSEQSIKVITDKLGAFSILLSRFNDLTEIFLDYFSSVRKRLELHLSNEPVIETRLLIAMFRLLVKFPLELSNEFEWNLFFNLDRFTDEKSKCVAFFISTYFRNVPEGKVERLFHQTFGACEDENKFNKYFVISELIEMENELEEMNGITFDDGLNIFPWSFGECLERLRVIEICGIYKRKGNYRNSNSIPTFVITNTLYECLYSLLSALSQRAPILITGPSACGKTHLIEYIADRMSTRLIKLQLTDSTDVKSLIGNYVCTENPGQFMFQDGVFVTAIKYGYWVLLDNVDAAPADVLTVISSLIKDGFVLTGGGLKQQIRIHPHFRLFGTITCKEDWYVSATMNVDLSSWWSRVSLKYPLANEIEEILDKRFEEMPYAYVKWISLAYCQLLIDIPKRVESGEVSFHKLVRWSKRVLQQIKSNQEELSLDERLMIAFEGFLVLSSKKSNNIDNVVLSALSKTLIVPEDQLKWMVSDRVIQGIETNNQSVQIGRIRLQEFSVGTTVRLRKSPFAQTQLSLKVLENLAAAVQINEPMLLVGETGTGKTSTVQYLADVLNVKLRVINMSQQSDSADLLGGFKPIDLHSHYILPMKDEFDELFRKTFSVKENQKFLDACRKVLCKQDWPRLIYMWKKAASMARTKQRMIEEWRLFEERVVIFDQKLQSGQSKVGFAFVEGILVNAVKEGSWLLLDEINLASPETLECLTNLIQSQMSSILLSERGDIDEIVRHPSFRLFACMNPSTDVGKKDLSPVLKSKFFDLWVPGADDLLETIQDLQNAKLSSSLLSVISSYLISTDCDDDLCRSIASFHMEMKFMANNADLSLASNNLERPHYSIRTLSRALTYARRVSVALGFKRALVEGINLSYLSILDNNSLVEAQKILQKYLSISSHVSRPDGCVVDDFHVEVWGFPLRKGNHQWNNYALKHNYIVTDSVRRNMVNVARAASSGYPVLLQGPTSVGKTSMIEYLAAMTGNRFVRINNHEHTDIQEYIGSYVWDNQLDRLRFKEGILVQAMRKGWWIVLDELNLAPTEVLEALNRLLDDNRELLISETGEVVKPVDGFMLFATQNPAGTVYGGRKHLSRAFRNRFVEIHFQNLPANELAIILERRCKIAPSYSRKFLNVYGDLQKNRSNQALFDGRDSLITLRDLFRWASRDTPGGEQSIAEDGYMLLAERLRLGSEKLLVKQALERHFKCHLGDIDTLYTKNTSEDLQGLTGTDAMRRLYYLVDRALKHREPVLLIGETGCGKTSVVQALAKRQNTQLHIVNCHQNSEASDFIGGLRPVRRVDSSGKLFEWSDGPLTCAMKEGHVFLLDEISLADDSVLERLNSVLETSRTLVISEASDTGAFQEISADSRFQFLATMNPGGDYGKKELSPALRNRFTEIWIGRAWNDGKDLSLLIKDRCRRNGKSVEDADILSQMIIEISDWMAKRCRYPSIIDDKAVHEKSILSLRELFSFADFCCKSHLSLDDSVLNGAEMTLIDGLVINQIISEDHIDELKEELIIKLANMGLKWADSPRELVIVNTKDRFGIEPFIFDKIEHKITDYEFVFNSETTIRNCSKVLRAMSIGEWKPVLLEGSPGVGKSSLIQAISETLGQKIVRINLSEQTDISELFGGDYPSDNGKFGWMDGPLVSAMKAGHWVLLDELNLASQSVLEGLNACLDHRTTVYLPELNLSIKCHPNFRVFATQNPQSQGGGRKGLPQSFLNRFIRLHLRQHTIKDMICICVQRFPKISRDKVVKIVEFNRAMSDAFGHQHRWEFNLRDVFRWLELLCDYSDSKVEDYLQLLYLNRFTHEQDKQKCIEIFETTFAQKYHWQLSGLLKLTGDNVQLGDCILPVDNFTSLSSNSSLFSGHRTVQLNGLMFALERGWMPIVYGRRGSGRRSMVRLLANICKHKLLEVQMHQSIDTQDLLGSFEQTGDNHHSFTWVDGPLVLAMKEGSWLMLSDANKCSAAVLDRLNSLVETSNGGLLLHESSGLWISPDPKFRLILTCDADSNTELSRAMRNRGLEISLTEVIEDDDCLEVFNFVPCQSYKHHILKATFSAKQSLDPLEIDYKLALRSAYLSESDEQLIKMVDGRLCDVYGDYGEQLRMTIDDHVEKIVTNISGQVKRRDQQSLVELILNRKVGDDLKLWDFILQNKASRDLKYVAKFKVVLDNANNHELLKRLLLESESDFLWKMFTSSEMLPKNYQMMELMRILYFRNCGFGVELKSILDALLLCLSKGDSGNENLLDYVLEKAKQVTNNNIENGNSNAISVQNLYNEIDNKNDFDLTVETYLTKRLNKRRFVSCLLEKCVECRNSPCSLGIYSSSLLTNVYDKLKYKYRLGDNIDSKDHHHYRMINIIQLEIEWLNEFSQISIESSKCLYDLGKEWMRLGKEMLSSVEFGDPSTGIKARMMVETEHIDYLNGQLETLKDFYHTFNTSDTILIDSTMKQLNQSQENIVELKKWLPWRPDNLDLKQLFFQVKQIQSIINTNSSVEDLKEIIHQFIQELKDKYSIVIDLIYPILASMRMILHGLDCLLVDRLRNSMMEDADFIRKLLSIDCFTLDQTSRDETVFVQVAKIQLNQIGVYKVLADKWLDEDLKDEISLEEKNNLYKYSEIKESEEEEQKEELSVEKWVEMISELQQGQVCSSENNTKKYRRDIVEWFIDADKPLESKERKRYEFIIREILDKRLQFDYSFDSPRFLPIRMLLDKRLEERFEYLQKFKQVKCILDEINIPEEKQDTLGEIVEKLKKIELTHGKEHLIVDGLELVLKELTDTCLIERISHWLITHHKAMLNKSTQLLESEDYYYSELWPNLYRIIMMNDAPQQDLLSELILFMQKSQLGIFEYNLRLFKVFSRFNSCVLPCLNYYTQYEEYAKSYVEKLKQEYREEVRKQLLLNEYYSSGHDYFNFKLHLQKEKKKISKLKKELLLKLQHVIDFNGFNASTNPLQLFQVNHHYSYNTPNVEMFGFNSTTIIKRLINKVTQTCEMEDLFEEINEIISALNGSEIVKVKKKLFADLLKALKKMFKYRQQPFNLHQILASACSTNGNQVISEFVKILHQFQKLQSVECRLELNQHQRSMQLTNYILHDLSMLVEEYSTHHQHFEEYSAFIDTYLLKLTHCQHKIFYKCSSLDSMLETVLVRLNLLTGKDIKMPHVDTIKSKDDWESLGEFLRGIKKENILLNDVIDNYLNTTFDQQSIFTTCESEYFMEMLKQVQNDHLDIRRIHELLINSLQLKDNVIITIHDESVQIITRDMTLLCQNWFKQQMNKKLLKLNDYIQMTSSLIQILIKIYSEGLSEANKDNESDGDDSEDKGEFEEDGTGMDARDKGEKDVSNEIEDEEQILGLENEQEEPNPNQQKQEEEDAGLEMQNDFKGELENVDQQQEENSEDGESEDGGNDEEMGSVDGDEGLDEQMWGEDLQDSGDLDELSDECPDDQPDGEEAGEKFMEGVSDNEFSEDDGKSEVEEEKAEMDEQKANELDDEVEMDFEHEEEGAREEGEEELDENNVDDELGSDAETNQNEDREENDDDLKFRKNEDSVHLDDDAVMEDGQDERQSAEDEEWGSSNVDNNQNERHSTTNNTNNSNYNKNEPQSDNQLPKTLSEAVDNIKKVFGEIRDKSEAESADKSLEFEHAPDGQMNALDDSETAQMDIDQVDNVDNIDAQKRNDSTSPTFKDETKLNIKQKELDHSNAEMDDNDDYKEEEDRVSIVKQVEEVEMVNSGSSAMISNIKELELLDENEEVLDLINKLNNLPLANLSSKQAWESLERQCNPAAIRLCENLRLVLEPTLRSKLKGDYKSGKRLNMRKIIPFIASNFKKDKIWLRRTMPNKRQYQVVVAIDDSKSMRESGAVAAAFQSLAILSKALTQLEVGSLAVFSFGETVETVVDFDQHFNAVTGSRVLDKFSFSQEKTLIKSLMEYSINQLDSRYCSSDTWKLEIIISDGLCENHLEVRRLVKRAMEKRILPLFIIIDKKSDENSIERTKSVSFVDGRIVMVDYMELFPFDYYLVLRDVQDLPSVLANALKQFLSANI